jgi:hypothetical protein
LRRLNPRTIRDIATHLASMSGALSSEYGNKLQSIRAKAAPVQQMGVNLGFRFWENPNAAL